MILIIIKIKKIININMLITILIIKIKTNIIVKKKGFFHLKLINF